MGFDEVFQQSGDAQAFIESCVHSRNLLLWEEDDLGGVWLCDVREDMIYRLNRDTLAVLACAENPNWGSRHYEPCSIGGDASVGWLGQVWYGSGSSAVRVLEITSGFAVVRVFDTPEVVAVFEMHCGGDDEVCYYAGAGSVDGEPGHFIGGRRRSDSDLFAEMWYPVAGSTELGYVSGIGGGVGTLWCYETRAAPLKSQVQRRHPTYPGIVLTSVDAPGIEAYENYEDIGGGAAGVWVCDSAGQGRLRRLSLPDGASIVQEVPSPGVGPVGIGGK